MKYIFGTCISHLDIVPYVSCIYLALNASCDTFVLIHLSEGMCYIGVTAYGTSGCVTFLDDGVCMPVVNKV